VWFRNIFLKTLRDCRVAILCWGLGIGVLTPLILVTVPTLLADSEMRAEVLALVRNPAMRLFAEPVDVLSPGGYATWRLSLVLPLLSIWALLAVSRTLRGEEESGALDVLLSVPRSRLRVATEKVVAIVIALLLMGVLIALLAYAGGRISSAGLGLAAALLFGLNVALLAGVFGALAMLVSQFTLARRSAAGITGALLGLSVVLTSASRTVPDGEWIGRLSPLYYFELNRPLIPSYGVRPFAIVVLVALIAGPMALGVALFIRRDVGAPIALPLGLPSSARQPRLAPTLPLSAWSLHSLFARSLASLGAATWWWGLALAIYVALITVILRQARQNVMELLESFSKSNPLYREAITRFTAGDTSSINATFFSALFTLLAVVVAAFAVTLVNRWAAEEEEGRLELLLSTPLPRPLVILTKFSAVVVALMIVAALIFASVALTGAVVDFTLDPARLAQAAFGLVLVGLVVAAFGYLLSGWLRTVTVTGILSALLLASFVITLLGHLFKWPNFLLQLSIFEQYGTPLLDGLRASHALGLLIVAAATLTMATMRFSRKDLAR
jgi:ABC-2 type transport system permease protein